MNKNKNGIRFQKRVIITREVEWNAEVFIDGKIDHCYEGWSSKEEIRKMVAEQQGKAFSRKTMGRNN